MEKEKLTARSILLFFVSDIYGATKKFRAGEPAELADRIRKTAVSLSATVNSVPETADTSDFSRIYPILSSISVLETYLQLAKRHRFLKDTAALDEKLSEVKEALYKILGQR